MVRRRVQYCFGPGPQQSVLVVVLVLVRVVVFLVLVAGRGAVGPWRGVLVLVLLVPLLLGLVVVLVLYLRCAVGQPFPPGANNALPSTALVLYWFGGFNVVRLLVTTLVDRWLWGTNTNNSSTRSIRTHMQPSPRMPRPQWPTWRALRTRTPTPCRQHPCLSRACLSSRWLRRKVPGKVILTMPLPWWLEKECFAASWYRSTAVCTVQYCTVPTMYRTVLFTTTSNRCMLYCTVESHTSL